MAEIELMMLDTPKTDYNSKKKNKLTDKDYKDCEKANEELIKKFMEKRKNKEDDKGIEMDMNEFLNK